MKSFTSKVAGIPCVIEVDRLFVQEPLGPRCDSDWDCYGFTEIEFTVCDRNGRYAPWLEKKLTDRDRERIEEEALENAKEYARDDY
jgi:hypothetical protein